jgi:hypothetical protein
MTLRFIATAANGDDITALLADFAGSIGLDRVAPGRYSFALVLGLFKGLWHKHHLEDGLRGTAINALKGLHRYGSPLFRQRMQEAQDAGEVRYVTQEDVASLADDIAHGNWQRMASAAQLTGEWIIYAQHDGANYYLCLGRHDSGDDYLRRQIDAICCREFLFLTALLSAS